MTARKSIRLNFGNRIVSLTAAVFVSLAAMCDGNATTPDSKDGFGAYRLTHIGPQPLPVTVNRSETATDTTYETFNSMTLTLNANGAWSYTGTSRIVVKHGPNTVSDVPHTFAGGGSFTRNGNTFALHQTSGDVGDVNQTATLVGTTLTIVHAGPEAPTFVFTKS